MEAHQNRRSALIHEEQNSNALPPMVSSVSGAVPEPVFTPDAVAKVRPEELLGKYDGSGDVTRWLLDVKDLVEIGKWSEKYTVRLMMAKIMGEARAFIDRAIPSSEPLTYSKIATNLELRFKPRTSLLSRLVEFRNCQQQRGETLPDYAARTRHLGFQTASTPEEVATLDPRLLVSFTMGLRDAQLKQAVLMGRPLDFKSAVELAMDFEAEFGRNFVNRNIHVNYVQSPSPSNSRKNGYKPQGNGASGNTGNNGNGSNRKDRCRFCKTVGHKIESCRRLMFKENRCFQCKEVGHQRKDCPQTSSSSQQDFQLAPLLLN